MSKIGHSSSILFISLSLCLFPLCTTGSPPVIELSGLVRGRHRLTVTPDCEMKKTLTLRFTS